MVFSAVLTWDLPLPLPLCLIADLPCDSLEPLPFCDDSMLIDFGLATFLNLVALDGLFLVGLFSSLLSSVGDSWCLPLPLT